MEVLSSRVLLRPLDPERTHHFYRDILGLAVYREYGDPPMHGGVVYFTGGGFLEVAGRSEKPAGPNIALWFQVRDLLAVYQELHEQNVPIVQPPETMPWGLKEMWIADPDGVHIAVIEVPEDHPLRKRS